MQWQEWGTRLKDVLGLKKSIVAVTYSDADPAGASGSRCRACSAVRLASQGAVIALNLERSACPGGSLYLGFREQPPEQAKTLRNFLINGEKLFASPTAVHRMLALSKVKPPLHAAEFVVFSPLEKAELRPDIAIFHCNAWQAARVVNLVWYENGMPMECDPTGSTCRSTITYPLVTGKVNVSFGDVTARRSEHAPEDELYVTLPFEHLRTAVASIENCGAGTAKMEMPPSMRQIIQEQSGEPPEF